jgi:hypothetical protein
MKKVSIVVSVLLVAGFVQAQSVPDFVNYQGRLTDEGGAPLATGDYALRFEVYDDPIVGSRVWGPLCFDLETGATPSDGHKFKVPVVQGYFNVVLDQDNGFTDCTDTTPDGDGLAAPVSTAFTAALRYVEVAVWNETGSVWEPILPRQHVLSSPYAVSAERSSEVVSAEGQPTRIACKTGPATEVDVITVSDAGVGITGALGVSGDLTVLGDASVAGDLDVAGGFNVTDYLGVGGAQIEGLFLTPVVSLHANRTVLYHWLAQYNGSESFCVLKRIYTLANPDDGNTLWWRLKAQGLDAIARCEAQCFRWDCGPGTCTPAKRGLCSLSPYPTCGGFCPAGQECADGGSACVCQPIP